MTKIKIYTTIVLVLISVLFLVSIIQIKDQYDEKLYKLDKQIRELKVDNHKLNSDNKKLKSDNAQMGLTIEDLDKQLQGKRKLECDCDCGWLQDFYDEFHEEVGAME